MPEHVPVEGKGVDLPVFDGKVAVVKRVKIHNPGFGKCLLDRRHGGCALGDADCIMGAVHLSRVGEEKLGALIPGTPPQHA